MIRRCFPALLLFLPLLLIGCSFSDDDTTATPSPSMDPPMPVLIDPAGGCFQSGTSSIQCSDDSICSQGLNQVACSSVTWERYSSGVFVDSIQGQAGGRVQFDAVSPGTYRVEQIIRAGVDPPAERTVTHNITVN